MAQRVIEAVETLSYAGRWSYMLALGRRAVSDPAAKRSIEALAASQDFYPRLLALMSSYASGDPAIILACIDGPSSDLFNLAYNLAARRLDDAALAAALLRLSRKRRAALARACMKAGRAAAIESAFDRLDRVDQAALLAYASPRFVEARLGGEFAEFLSANDWGRLATRHPALVGALLTARLAEAPEPSHHLLEAVASASHRMADSAPRRALDLLRAGARRAPLSRFYFRRLANLFPNEIAEMILADTAARPPRCPPAMLRHVDDETRAALLRLDAGALTAREFRRLKPAVRRSLYGGWSETQRGAEGALPERIVAALPREARLREARHAAGLPQFAAYPAKRLPYVAFLPYEEALREAGVFASQPDAALRALANATTVAAGRYEPSRLPEILDFCRTKRNEQDPVRQAMIGALARLPPSRWRLEHLPAIRGVVDDALAARDCSAQTMAAASRLLVALAPFHFDFVAPELSKLVERLGSFHGADLGDRLSDAQARALAPHILPLLTTWRARSQTAAALGFVAALGERLKAAPALIDFVAGLTTDLRRDVAEPALDLLARRRAHAAVDALTPRLIEADPSWICCATVARHLHGRRQDLLTPFLSARAYKGRFDTGATRIIPNFRDGFIRWTQAQQLAYAEAVIGVARGAKRSAWELRRAVAVLAAMPAVPADAVAQFASLDNSDVALRDTALAALGRIDGGRGAPTLIAALADERARVAIYALRRIILEMPSVEATALLAAAPLGKVTVAKEVARLAGELEGEAAYRFLARFLERPDTHVDVRIAAMRALWTHLERPETWTVFAEAARSEAAAVARATVRIPQDRLSAAARARLAEHMALLLRHPSPLVRLDTLRRLAAMPLATTPEALADELANLLDRPTEEEVGLAASALAAATPPERADALAATLTGVASSRALQAVAEAVIAASATRPERTAPLAERFVGRLVAARRHIGLAMRVALAALLAPALVEAARSAVAAGRLHPGAVAEAIATASRLMNLRRGATLATVEPQFGDAPEPAMRRIGLALLVADGAAHGWSAAARTRLDAYRADADPWVAEAATLTFPPEAPPAAR